MTILKYCFYFVLVTGISGQTNSSPKRYDLIHYLVNENRYDPSLPPGFYSENVTNVAVELSIYDLNSESDINMEYECTLYLRMNWTDKRLDFTANNTTYAILSLGDTMVDKIWIPDIYFHHERTSEMHGLVTNNQLVYIYRNGSVFYSGRFNIKSHCKMNLKQYPFDTQTCPIIIQSYSLSKDDLILKWNGDKAVNVDNIVNLKNVDKSQKHSYESPYHNPAATFSTLSAEIQFKRPKQSFALMYIVPPVIFVGVSLTTFILGDNVGSRIIVPTGSLTQLIFQWVGIYNKLPAVSVVTNFDTWMLVNLSFVGAILVANAIIYRFVYLKDTPRNGLNANAPSNVEGAGNIQRENSEKCCNKQNLKIKLKRSTDKLCLMIFVVIYGVFVTLFCLCEWNL